VQLIWRDAKEVVKDLLSNPMFTNHMTFNPHVVVRGMEREYSEFFTGNQAYYIQVDSEVNLDRICMLIVHQAQLPVGATIIPIILASDKTPVVEILIYGLILFTFVPPVCGSRSSL
jgi:hypothetical protein